MGKGKGGGGHRVNAHVLGVRASVVEDTAQAGPEGYVIAGRRNLEKEGRSVLFRESGVKPMELEDARIGTRVLVRSDYREPHRQGSVGTIRKRYGTPDYTAFEVLFPDGQTELFWDHQLEEVNESACHPKKRWWRFW